MHKDTGQNTEICNVDISGTLGFKGLKFSHIMNNLAKQVAF
jgi:hypothetical protein